MSHNMNVGRRMCERCQDVHMKGLKSCDCSCHNGGYMH